MRKVSVKEYMEQCQIVAQKKYPNGEYNMLKTSAICFFGLGIFYSILEVYFIFMFSDTTIITHFIMICLIIGSFTLASLLTLILDLKSEVNHLMKTQYMTLKMQEQLLELQSKSNNQ